jgi:hypothetical protein
VLLFLHYLCCIFIHPVHFPLLFVFISFILFCPFLFLYSLFLFLCIIFHSIYFFLITPFLTFFSVSFCLCCAFLSSFSLSHYSFLFDLPLVSSAVLSQCLFLLLFSVLISIYPLYTCFFLSLIG